VGAGPARERPAKPVGRIPETCHSEKNRQRIRLQGTDGKPWGGSVPEDTVQSDESSVHLNP